MIRNKKINFLTDKSFIKRVSSGKWENHTLDIIDSFANKEHIILDIGAWNGITTLYGASDYKKVVAIEADPKAIEKFKKNVGVNDFTNIILINKAISDRNGLAEFGGNGGFGNSESTLLVSDEGFIKEGGEKTRGRSINSEDYRGKQKTQVETIEPSFILQYLTDPVGLIKMDIEGGEKIVIPAMKEMLTKLRSPLLLSLHWVYLKNKDIDNILNYLFKIYEVCYDDQRKRTLDKQSILDKKISTVLFTYYTI